MIGMDERLRINALVDRLVEPGKTYAAGLARDLIRTMPLTNGHPTLRVLTKGGVGTGITGHAPGIGDVDLRDDKPASKAYQFGPDQERVGGYKLTHKPGTILIELMWAETRPFDDGQFAILRYDRATGNPGPLCTSMPRVIHVPFWPGKRISFSMVGFAVWKLPVEDDGDRGRDAEGTGTPPRHEGFVNATVIPMPRGAGSPHRIRPHVRGS